MLSTSSRFTQTLDSGVARAVSTDAVSTAAMSTASGASCVTGNVSTAGYPTAFGFGAWTAIERKPMPKVDLHPDRWPLHSTS